MYVVAGIPAQISTMLLASVFDAIARMHEAETVARSAHAAAAGILFLVFLPFWLLQSPFWLIGVLVGAFTTQHDDKRPFSSLPLAILLVLVIASAALLPHLQRTEKPAEAKSAPVARLAQQSSTAVARPQEPMHTPTAGGATDPHSGILTPGYDSPMAAYSAGAPITLELVGDPVATPTVKPFEAKYGREGRTIRISNSGDRPWNGVAYYLKASGISGRVFVDAAEIHDAGETKAFVLDEGLVETNGEFTNQYIDLDDLNITGMEIVINSGIRVEYQ
ncbi:MAG: hypothetical protein ABFE08_02065 [Armatimonadia bacterium]